MANATIKTVWTDANAAYMAATVSEVQTVNGVTGPVTVEYIGSIPLASFSALPDVPSKKAALMAAVKVVRDASLPQSNAIGGIAGSAVI